MSRIVVVISAARSAVIANLFETSNKPIKGIFGSYENINSNQFKIFFKLSPYTDGSAICYKQDGISKHGLCKLCQVSCYDNYLTNVSIGRHTCNRATSWTGASLGSISWGASKETLLMVYHSIGHRWLQPIFHQVPCDICDFCSIHYRLR